jgi:Flp pilus assembly protein TadD
MSKKLVAACLAALAFSACEDKSTTPTPPTVAVETKVQLKSPPPPVVSTPELAVDARPDGGTTKGKPKTLAQVDPAFDGLALAHDTPAVDHLARAKALVSEGDVKGGLAEARRAVYSSPTDTEALTVAARLARRTGQPVMAAEAWGRVALESPDDAVPLIEQARALYVAKDYPGTVMAGREAIGRDDENPEAHHIVGLAQLSMGELKGAIQSFERTVQLEPGHGWALNNLGFCYLRANENEKAAKVLGEAAEKLPHVAFVQNNLGVALERVGRTEEAKSAYQKAMDLSPKYVKARINAARVARAEAEGLEGEDVPAAIPVTSPVETEPPAGAHPMPEAPKP